ncbi:hypothetical protein ABIF38_008234 [Bradyrhizobium japonicum]|jgi:hypothetical protein|uniref:Uncharacterized protein n=2 Tax=Bradyrhizobium elkanii TaxID=29448 RepID=A0ABV4EWK9_BRAEL|nr:hypothetical protein [Bradyrhizobium elkanii]MBP2428332.1 hypothetical protein [Bradyrhizobium elkanii]MCP1729450.1 hypothetical protein [Bradyrhizobium elkanii]MCP1756185.1 hypothetical protein [Bradyrhizobium elkanii]MCP1981700.1 hypothetical protein [Bradyrhizobium elkanii]MCS3573579.1 hypothetical protein [Bradyrhizobium elkanii]
MVSEKSGFLRRDCTQSNVQMMRRDKFIVNEMEFRMLSTPQPNSPRSHRAAMKGFSRSSHMETRRDHRDCIKFERFAVACAMSSTHGMPDEIILAAQPANSDFRFVDGERLAHRLDRTLPRVPPRSK